MLILTAVHKEQSAASQAASTSVPTTNTTIDSDADFFSVQSGGQTGQPHLQYCKFQLNFVTSACSISIMLSNQCSCASIPQFRQVLQSKDCSALELSFWASA